MLKRLSSEVITKKVNDQPYTAEKIIKYNEQFNKKFIDCLNEDNNTYIRIYPLDILSKRTINKIISKSKYLSHVNLFCTSDIFNITLLHLKNKDIKYNLERAEEGYYVFSLIKDNKNNRVKL